MWAAQEIAEGGSYNGPILGSGLAEWGRPLLKAREAARVVTFPLCLAANNISHHAKEDAHE